MQGDAVLVDICQDLAVPGRTLWGGYCYPTTTKNGVATFNLSLADQPLPTDTTSMCGSAAVQNCSEVPTNTYCLSCGTNGKRMACVAGSGVACLVSTELLGS